MNPQPIQALERANRVRIGIATLTREVGQMPRQEGLTYVADLIENTTDDIALRARVEVLVGSPRRWGKMLTKRLLRRLHIDGTQRLGDLPDRQRRLLAQALRVTIDGGPHRVETTTQAGFVRVS